MRRIRKPSPALVVAVVALFAALGGGAFAATVINGANIKKLSIRGDKLINGTITSNKIHSRQLNGVQIKDNSLTGRQVKESSLGTVPSASKAGDATTVGGRTVKRFSFAGALGATEQPILDVDGLQIRASCSATGAPQVRATTSSNDSELQGQHVNQAGTTIGVRAKNFDIGQTVDLDGGAGNGNGTLTYARADGTVVSVTYSFDNTPNLGTHAGCLVTGTAIG